MSGKGELGRAYAAFREAEAPSAQERAEAWAEIQARIAQGETGPVIKDAAAPASAPGVRTVIAVAAVAAAVAAAITLPTAHVLDRGRRDGLVEAEFSSRATGGLDGEALIRVEASPEAAPRRTPTRPRRGVEPREAPAERDAPIDSSLGVLPVDESDGIVEGRVEAEVPRPVVSDDPIGRSGAARRRVAKRSRADAAQPSRPEPEPDSVDRSTAAVSLQEEARGLQAARSALARREPRAALDLVRQHERRFPNTALRRERAALELLALCGLGRAGAVKGRVAAFERRHAGSALAQRVERACRSQE